MNWSTSYHQEKGDRSCRKSVISRRRLSPTHADRTAYPSHRRRPRRRCDGAYTHRGGALFFPIASYIFRPECPPCVRNDLTNYTCPVTVGEPMLVPFIAITAWLQTTVRLSAYVALSVASRAGCGWNSDLAVRLSGFGAERKPTCSVEEPANSRIHHNSG